MYIQDALDGPNMNRRVLLNHENYDNYANIQSFSRDGEVFAYGLPVSGSEWHTVHFLNVSSKQKLADVLTKVKNTNIKWKGNEGIFYEVS